MGVPGPRLIAFEQHGARGHLVRIKALDFHDKELFGRLDELFPHRATLGLQGGAELELGVIDESERGWPALRLRDRFHELDADLVVVEDETIEDLDLGNRSHTDCSLSDNAKVAFTPHHDVVHVGAVGDSWPQARLRVGAGRGDIGHIAQHVLDVSVSILLHSAGSR